MLEINYKMKPLSKILAVILMVVYVVAFTSLNSYSQPVLDPDLKQEDLEKYGEESRR